MTCNCAPCSFCDGSGRLWYSCDGEYVGIHSSDDMGHYEPCEECGGTGIGYLCDECRQIEEDGEKWRLSREELPTTPELCEIAAFELGNPSFWHLSHAWFCRECSVPKWIRVTGQGDWEITHWRYSRPKVQEELK